jgi:putative endonuclease
MQYFSYVLISEVTGRRYFGSCEDLNKRLKEHNAGKVKSSKPYRPYSILYFEIFETRAEARQREMFFKSVEGYKYLKQKGII